MTKSQTDRWTDGQMDVIALPLLVVCAQAKSTFKQRHLPHAPSMLLTTNALACMLAVLVCVYVYDVYGSQPLLQ